MILYDTAIIGAGPAGLFSIFQGGMLGLKTCVIDTLNFIGGQCRTLYAQKPIYDIPGFHIITAQELIDNLEKQATPFKPKYFLGQQCKNIKKHNSYWLLETSKSTIKTKTIIIATGAGFFDTRKPPLKNIQEYENISVFYHIDDKKLFKDKIITIAGGGDSALDWAVLLADSIAKKVYLVHRRSDFRAMPKTVEKMNKLCKINKIRLITPYQLESIEGNNGYLHTVTVKDLDGNLLSFKSDYLLPFFGMSTNMGPINNWNIFMKNKHIEVNPETMQTNLTGIYAIGDVCNYPGKLKLILTGFAESARACYSAYNIINPDTPLHFQHSTIKGIPKGGNQE